MSAKKWMQWLSVMALISILLEIFGSFSLNYGSNFNLTSLSLGVLLLSIVAVISIFNKK